MKKIIFTILFCINFFAIGQEKNTIFILPPSMSQQVDIFYKKSVYKADLDQLLALFDTNLQNIFGQLRQYSLVDRRNLKTTDDEQKFNDSGMTGSVIAKKYQYTGAKYIAVPVVSIAEITLLNQKQFDVSKRISLKFLVRFGVSVQIIDSSTGEVKAYILPKLIELSDSFDIEATEKIDFTKLLLKVVNNITSELGAKIGETILPAKVLAINGKTEVMINKGEAAGFKIGAKVEIFAEEKLKDVDSDEIFTNEILVGKGEIIRSDSQKSFAKLVGDNFGIARGCVVRISEEKQ